MQRPSVSFTVEARKICTPLRAGIRRLVGRQGRKAFSSGVAVGQGNERLSRVCASIVDLSTC